MALEKELAAFRQQLPALLAVETNRGGFALMHGENVAGVYPTFDSALEAGYETFGLDPFLIQPIVEREKPIFFSRNLRCQS